MAVPRQDRIRREITQRAEAPKQGSSSPPFEPSGKKSRFAGLRVQKCVPPWAYIIARSWPSSLLGIHGDTENRNPASPARCHVRSSIPTPSPAPEIRSSTAPSATPLLLLLLLRTEGRGGKAGCELQGISAISGYAGPSLQMFERELARQVELHKAQKDLYEKGAISAAEVRAVKGHFAAARKDVDDTRKDIKAADRMMGEIELSASRRRRQATSATVRRR